MARNGHDGSRIGDDPRKQCEQRLQREFWIALTALKLNWEETVTSVRRTKSIRKKVLLKSIDQRLGQTASFAVNSMKRINNNAGKKCGKQIFDRWNIRKRMRWATSSTTTATSITIIISDWERHRIASRNILHTKVVPTQINRPNPQMRLIASHLTSLAALLKQFDSQFLIEQRQLNLNFWRPHRMTPNNFSSFSFLFLSICCRLCVFLNFSFVFFSFAFELFSHVALCLWFGGVFSL